MNENNITMISGSRGGSLSGSQISTVCCPLLLQCVFRCSPFQSETGIQNAQGNPCTGQ